MSHILVGFCTKHNSLISRLICWATRWRHSHMVLINSDRTEIIESTGIPFPDPETGEIRDGVRKVPYAYLTQRDMVEVRAIDFPDPEGLWKLAEQMAKEKRPYDHEYLGAWLLRRGNGDEYKINCFEIVSVNAARLDYPLFPDDMTGITPRDFYLLSKEL